MNAQSIDITESPVLTLPEDEKLVKRLEAKLAEYKTRMEEIQDFRHPEFAYKISPSFKDAFCKFTVLGRLLDCKKVNTFELALEIAARFENVEFDVDSFNNACGVIAAYSGQSDQEPQGGTGLPEV